MNKHFPVLLAAALLAACTDDESGLPALVFESGPRLAQCEAPAITPQQSAAKLTQAGIDVHATSCGMRTGVAYAAVCGGGTPDIILHDIPAGAVAEAGALGFLPADGLVDAARQTGWQRIPCSGLNGFRELALTTAGCAQTRNRLLLITAPTAPDEQLVLLDQAGNCADAAYRQVLFGDSVDEVLCTNHDSIAGPMKHCDAPEHADLFDTILANLDKPDLGLGAGHHVDAFD